MPYKTVITARFCLKLLIFFCGQYLNLLAVAMPLA